MATVITVAQQKGGAGKTTVAAQLAVAWGRGHSVAMIDVDPQGSLTAWFRIREESLGSSAGMHLSDIPGWRLGTELDRLRRRFDFVIIDSPPHAESDARAAIRAGDLVVVPIQPSPLDLWATKATLDLAQKEKRRTLLVVNRLPPRGKLPDVILGTLRADGVPVASNTLGNRTAFASSMMEGKGVIETAHSASASQEIAALAEEIAAAARRS